EFIQYLDSDDRLLPEKFAVQVDALQQHPECGIAYGRTRLVDENDDVLASPYKWSGESRDTLFPGLLVDRWWNTHTPLYRRQVCDAVGSWATMRMAEDWQYDARMGALGTKLVHCNVDVSEHRQHSQDRLTGGQLSRSALQDFSKLIPALYDCARQAGVPPDAAEMHHFIRWTFSLSRQLGHSGLPVEAMHCFDTARQAAEAARAITLDMRVYQMVARFIDTHETILDASVTAMQSLRTSSEAASLQCEKIVLLGESGQLCIRIFPFAHVIAFAAEHGLTVCNPGFAEYASEFEGSRCGMILTYPLRIDPTPPAWIKRLTQRAMRWQHRLLRRLAPSAFVSVEESEEYCLDDNENLRSFVHPTMYLRGLYLIDRSSFAKHQETVRAYFEPRRETQQSVDTCVATARQHGDIIVGVHVRQGDYQTHFHGLLYYESEEYAELMQDVVTLFPGRRVRFIVCSNVAQPVETFAEFSWQPGPGSAVGDLYTLAACDYIIGAASTYSQWASFYGNVPRYVHNKKVNEHFGHETPPAPETATQPAHQLDTHFALIDHHPPVVSAVVAARNEEQVIEPSVRSLLNQTLRDIEIIVVNDGSTDRTAEILSQLQADDARLRVLSTTGIGLTRALILGCQQARGTFIARHDADDFSAPTRFEKQVKALESNGDAVLATSWIEEINNEGDLLSETRNVQYNLAGPDGKPLTLQGIPAHGTTMFRREAYEQAGGYSPEFYFAQDCDLWLRLHHLGGVVVVEEFLYQRVTRLDSISVASQQFQAEFARISQECFRRRLSGKDEAPQRKEAEALRERVLTEPKPRQTAAERATAFLLIGARIGSANPSLARSYYTQALRECPYHLRTWRRLLMHLFLEAFTTRVTGG
ncbi:Chondroitin synthase (CS) [Includes: Glucuronosyl-N-acetylgalactosaminyl-proteoglycan 4-beta-N-acetylgalactosaminyltransferase (UDP-GalNAc transferase), partial [Durusdinium trenchii]